ncbi:MAG: endonuclease/exonuclease/phosphatase family protein [Chloroflexota bacterium]
MWRPTLYLLLSGITLLVGILTIVVLLRRFHWSGDLAALIVDYLVGISFLLIIGFALVGGWRWLAVAGMFFAINSYVLLSYHTIDEISPSDQIERSDAERRRLRIMVYNVYYRNPDVQSIVDGVRYYNPDVLFLMEYSNAIQAQIETAFADYPYQLIQPSRMTMGLALFSRISIQNSEIHRFSATRIPIFQATMDLNGTPFTFVGGHPWPPLPRWAQLHRDQVTSIAQVASQAEHPLIVAGDFNASQWSYALSDLSNQAEVSNILRPLNFTKTSSPAPLVHLAIDHVLVSDGWSVSQIQFGQPGGSDHKPIIVDLGLD